MLAYAPERRMIGASRNSRKTMMMVVAGHMALVAVALTTKMTIDIVRGQDPTVLINYPIDPPPDPVVVETKVDQHPAATDSRVERVRQMVETNSQSDPVIFDSGPSISTQPDIGKLVEPYRPVVLDPPHEAVKVAAVLRTSEADLRPPYPLDKIRAQEEATLRLRLTIDDKGRVVAVDPVGKADPSFLAAARRHLMRSWRYTPATVDGVATGTTMVISLSFRLEDA